MSVVYCHSYHFYHTWTIPDLGRVVERNPIAGLSVITSLCYVSVTLHKLYHNIIVCHKPSFWCENMCYVRLVEGSCFYQIFYENSHLWHEPKRD